MHGHGPLSSFRPAITHYQPTHQPSVGTNLRLLALGAHAIAMVLCTHALQKDQIPFDSTGRLSRSSLSPLLDLHRSLVEVPSVTGSEHNVSQVLAGYLQDRGYTVELQSVEKDRRNVLAYFGASRESRVLVTSHIDTVPPFLPYERRGDEIWGRGASDAKGSVAAQITAVNTLREQQVLKDGDVALLYVVGEEKGGQGMKAANDLGLSWESVIFGEPTELKLARGHKGGIAFEVFAQGKAGHSGYPELGRNAIDILVDGLSALRSVQLPGSKEFGNSTLNIGQIEGGVATNVIPESASAKVLVRLAVDNPSAVRTLIQDTVEKASRWLRVVFSSSGIGPVRIDHDVPGFETVATNYGTDIPSLEGEHKRYLYGPGSILVSHSDHEHVSVGDLAAAVDGYQALIKAALDSSR